MGFSGLDEGQGLEQLVHRPEATGKGRDGAGVGHEHHLPSEEVAEVDELRILSDDFVGRGFKGQPDPESEASFLPRSLVAGLHDAVAGSGDRHPACFPHQATEFPRRGVVGVVLRGAGGTEDRDLRVILPRSEDSVGVAEFLHRGCDQLEFTGVCAVTSQTERGGDHRFDEAELSGFVDAGISFCESANAGVPSGSFSLI